MTVVNIKTRYFTEVAIVLCFITLINCFTFKFTVIRLDVSQKCRYTDNRNYTYIQCKKTNTFHNLNKSFFLYFFF